MAAIDGTSENDAGKITLRDPFKYVDLIGNIRSEDAIKEKDDLDAVLESFNVQLTNPAVCLPGVDLIADALDLSREELLRNVRDFYFDNRDEVLSHCGYWKVYRGITDMSNFERYLCSNAYCADEIGLLCIAMWRQIQITVLLKQNTWSTMPEPIDTRYSTITLAYVGKGLFLFTVPTDQNPDISSYGSPRSSCIPAVTEQVADSSNETTDTPRRVSRREEFLAPKTAEELQLMYKMNITSQTFLEALDLPLWRIPEPKSPQRRCKSAPGRLEPHPFSKEWSTRPHKKVKPITIRRRTSRYNTRHGSEFQVARPKKDKAKAKAKVVDKAVKETTTPKGQLTVRAHTLVIKKPCKYVCSTCRNSQKDVRFHTQKELNEHTVMDHGKIKCTVSNCTKEYASKAGLQKHLKTHQVGDWLCHICGRQWPHESDLITHLKSHAGQREHKCQGCDKAFVHFSDLKRHAAVHQNKRYHCDHCNYSSLSKHDRDDHSKSHDPERYKCKGCGATYMHRGAHNAHAAVCYGYVPRKRQKFD